MPICLPNLEQRKYASKKLSVFHLGLPRLETFWSALLDVYALTYNDVYTRNSSDDIP